MITRQDALDGLRVVSSEVSWGAFESDGSLGYEGGCCPAPRCRADLRDWRILSAHAPSKIVLESDAPLEVLGFLNASARFDPRNPVEFWADWNFVGDARVPGEATATRRLAPGRHILVAASEQRDSRHTLWAVRKVSYPLPPAQLTVVTIAAYPEKLIPASIGVLARSARKQGIDLEVCFVGESYPSHSEMKTGRLRQVIQSLRTPRVLYLDGRDSLFLAGLDRIETAFLSLDARLVVSTEAECWPVAELAPRFPLHAAGCHWLNAGQWMGEREAVLLALGVLEDMWNCVRTGTRRDWPRDLFAHPRAAGDDQFLWHVAWLNHLIELTPDYEGRVFRNVNTLDRGLCNNRHFDLDDGVVYKPSGQRPCILHFSGYAANECMHQWGGMLGAY
jgi:hypothetical protein